jgi:2-polyprenyl-3-methyl-5-hydroxy-6-metoxy-1,4-benzoquinol methylase
MLLSERGQDAMTTTAEQLEAGQAVYTQRVLRVYDFIVLGISNRFIWKCPTPRLLEHYDRHVSGNHLDVGVGTGYFLDRCRFPTATPRVALLDMNANALAFASRRIARYRPEAYRRNVVLPVDLGAPRFDSIAINYLLHCIPGSIESKAVIFDRLIPLMNPDAVLFGSTLLSRDVSPGPVGRRLMRFYNRKGIFGNENDGLDDLERELRKRFSVVSIDRIGCAALFSARA